MHTYSFFLCLLLFDIVEIEDNDDDTDDDVDFVVVPVVFFGLEIIT